MSGPGARPNERVSLRAGGIGFTVSAGEAGIGQVCLPEQVGLVKTVLAIWDVGLVKSVMGEGEIDHECFREWTWSRRIRIGSGWEADEMVFKIKFKNPKKQIHLKCISTYESVSLYNTPRVLTHTSPHPQGLVAAEFWVFF